MVANPYVVGGAAPAEAALRVLVIPHAGAGASSTLALRRHVPADWLVAGARLPGRESRIAEPVTDLAALVADVVRSARDLPGKAPLLIVGVCFGAIVALEAARELERADPGTVAGLVVVSHWSIERPLAPDERPVRSADGPAGMLAALRSFGAIPAGIADDPDVLGTYLPTIAADVRVTEGHHADPSPRLPCPILVVAGDADRLCPPEAMAGWALYSEHTREVRVTGGHMLLIEEPAALAQAIAANLDLFDGGAL